MPDPGMNARLRLAMQNARAENMPKDNIERAIKKAAGGDAENYEAIRYEGYGPGGVAVIVEALTDNRNRTGGAVRAVFTKHGGNLGETGSVAFMFAQVGRDHVSGKRGSADEVLEAAIEAGADDVQSDAERACDRLCVEDLGERIGALQPELGEPSLARRCGSAQTTSLDEERAASVMKLMAGTR